MPEFLDWLTIRLNELGWTQRRLADETGLHEVTISFIRNRRHTASPNSRGKILQAIGPIPDDGIMVAEVELADDEPEIPDNDDVGQITEHNPYDREDWPVGPGVYIFYDASERPMYVGQSQNIYVTLRDRYLADARRPHWLQPPTVATLKFVPVESRRIREAVEVAMITSMRKFLLFNTAHAG